MKNKPPHKPCRVPTCPEITTNKTGYCNQCNGYEKAVKQRYNTRYDKKTDPFYGSTRWQRLRTKYKKDHPLCQVCLNDGTGNGRVVETDVIDHIHEIKDGGKDGGKKWAYDNLLSLCNRCHAIKTAEMQKARARGEIRMVVMRYRQYK